MLSVFCCFFAIIFNAIADVNVGDSCVLTATGEAGKCTLISECPMAEDLDSEEPQICETSGTAAVICCPKKQRKPGEISKEKCREYSKYVYVKRKPPITLVGAQPIVRNECGFKVAPLVSGGTEAKIKEFPHMVALGYNTSNGIVHLCGGSLISEEFVLTAAHCVDDRQYGKPKQVKTGIIDINDDSHARIYQIVDSIMHPDYRPSSHYYDVALMKLQGPVRLDPKVRPACLYTKFEIDHNRAIACGWGKTDYFGPTSDVLLKVVVDFFNVEKCNKTFRNQIEQGMKLKSGINGNTQICAGSTDGRDTCRGDSGGPLQIYHLGDNITCMYDMIGVTSFGKICGTNSTIGVYSRISNYIKWIEDIVWPV